MNTAILLGAGSSVAAGFPSTQCLTDLVLSGHGVKRHTNASYEILGAEPLTGETLLANCMARRLHAEAERYYSTYAERRTHYEDLFYLARQVSDELEGEMENPAVRSFVKALRGDMTPLVEDANKEPPRITTHSFSTLIRETCNYIADIVWRCLWCKPTSQSHLDVIAHACKSVNVTSISTLCHDTHVETFLREKGIPISDGFSEPEADVRYWNGDFSSSGAIPFLKLHGSVNWFCLRPDSEDFYDERIGIPLSDDHSRTKTNNGEFQSCIGGRPLLLIGTFNKISQYSSGIFGELHYRFRSTISEANQMVICGYGFGDKGINTEIIEWYYDKRGRRVVIIHPDPDSLVNNARPAIRREWTDEWEKNGSISIIKKRFEAVDIDEFEETITT